MQCPYCGRSAVWCDNKIIYGQNYGRSFKIWHCKPCDAYVGCHNNSQKPLGTLANRELRVWRQRAHQAIDPLWQSGKVKRWKVYEKLQRAFGREIHVGESDIKTCREIIERTPEIFNLKKTITPKGNKSMSFLPENYKAPETSSRYMKLKDGDNNFRVLSKAIVGWMYWNNDGKPVRLREEPQHLPSDIRMGKDGKAERVKHFWAFVVYNLDKRAIEILEITQSSIQEGIMALVNHPKWGSPSKYDLTINRTGVSLETNYNVMPSPASELPEDAMSEMRNPTISLEALYTGGNPFTEKNIDDDLRPIMAPSAEAPKEVVAPAEPQTDEIRVEDIPF